MIEKNATRMELDLLLRPLSLSSRDVPEPRLFWRDDDDDDVSGGGGDLEGDLLPLSINTESGKPIPDSELANNK